MPLFLSFSHFQQSSSDQLLVLMAFAFSLLHTLFSPYACCWEKSLVAKCGGIWTRPPGDHSMPPRHSAIALPGGPPLHVLPPEILEKIFRSACTDGGRTGCSLSLVSKRVRAASTAARYHSISLLAGSPRKLRGFVECFENVRSAARTTDGSATPRIRHLCLSLYPATPTCFLYRPVGKALDLHGWLDTLSVAQYGDEGWTSFRNHAAEDYHAAVQTLFQMVSGDVQSMCLFGSTEWWEDDLTMPAITCSGFPMLTELAVSGDEPRFALLPERTYALDTPFPVLARLRIVADAHQNVDFQRWVDQTHRLESMRISCGGNVYAPGWISSLQDAIGAWLNWSNGGK